MHDAYRTFTNLTFSFMKTREKNAQNSLRLDRGYGGMRSELIREYAHYLYLSTYHFTSSSTLVPEVFLDFSPHEMREPEL